jgi:hypothetical protein
MTRVIGSIAALAIVVGGCRFPGVQEWEIRARNRHWAKIAWKQVEPKFKAEGGGRPLLNDYGRGWRDGYASVAGGSSGTIPLFPPTRYWGAKYQNPTGRDEISSWFAGWEAGTAAAEQDGVGYWAEIPTSGGEEAALAMRRMKPPVEPVPPGPPVEALPPGPPADEVEELPPAKLTNFMSKALGK